jgi:hypothetical protein
MCVRPGARLDFAARSRGYLAARSRGYFAARSRGYSEADARANRKKV